MWRSSTSALAAVNSASLAGKVPLDENTVVMLTGGNTDAADFAAMLMAQE